MPITVTATPNTPNCSIRAVSDLNDTASLDYSDGSNNYGPLTATSSEMEDVNYVYSWVLNNISSGAEAQFTANVTILAETGSTNWTQPAVLETGTDIVYFPEVAKTTVARIGEMSGTIFNRRFSTPEEWSELMRLIKNLTIVGRTVYVQGT